MNKYIVLYWNDDGDVVIEHVEAENMLEALNPFVEKGYEVFQCLKGIAFD